MAKTKISEFSATPGNNTDIDGINIAEGCAPSGINDAIRELMAQLKDFQTGAAGDSFNGPVGTTTAAAGAFTTLSASSSVTLSGGTANGVAYLNASKVLTTGSALTFDGTNLATTGSVFLNNAQYFYSKTSGGTNIRMLGINSGNTAYVGPIDSGPGDTILNASSSSTNIQFYASGTEQMRLTSTGLGIGTTTSPSSSLVRQVVAGNGVYSQWTRTSTTLGGGYIGTDGAGLIFGTHTGTVGSETYTERARIDSSGNLLVGVTSTTPGNARGFSVTSVGAGEFRVFHSTTDGSGDPFGRFIYNGTQIGSITQSGTTATAYNTSSDYRLKENIQPMTGALAKVAALKPCTYKWKADGSDGEGFIAHELAEVCPQAVTGEKDAVDAEGNPQYQGIDTSFLAGLYAAAIQELKAELDSVKSELASLKG